MNQDLICILGPTASGKTKYAVKMAYDVGGEIISADSRQVYRGMDIGTGKDISEYHINGVDIPYHLIDIVDAGTKYNVFEYQRDFKKAYMDIVGRGRQPILCGGTGMYIESVTKGYSLPEVPPNQMLREELELLPTEVLVSRLAALRPLHNRTDVESRKRLIRALEIALYQQVNPVEYSEALQFNTRFIGISVSREVRNARIDQRLKDRLDNGMVEEVKALLDRGIAPDDLIYYGLEYKFVTLYLIGKLTYGQMEEQLAVAIHQFAKRQMTWFRGMERRGVRIEWIEI